MTAQARRELTERVRSLALALGFDRVGVAPAEPYPEAERFREWLASGFAGSMDYLARRADERTDPRLVLDGARSVLVVGLVYADAEAGGDPEAEPNETPGLGRVSRYARGDDYHEVLLDRLRALEAGLPALVGRPLRSRSYVDTGPVLERMVAARAGLGWIGKNACLIDPRLGSYLFLGVLLTDLELECDEPEPDHCGTCRACLDACPTDAFPEPYVLDARRCIAYTTIEDPGPMPAGLRSDHEDRVFGCDLCQEVCPWNRRAGARGDELSDPLGLRERLAPREHWEAPTLEWLLSLDEAGWREATRRSAMRRGGYRGLMRNALVAAGNAGLASLTPLVERFAKGDDPLLAEHAEWALECIGAQGSLRSPW